MAWSMFDGTGREPHMAGDADAPPYESVLAAMKDGWRGMQVPPLVPAYPGQEHQTAFLRFEYVLERMVDLDAAGAASGGGKRG